MRGGRGTQKARAHTARAGTRIARHRPYGTALQRVPLCDARAFDYQFTVFGKMIIICRE